MFPTVDNGYTYLGTLDDAVVKYPWKFTVDDEYLQSTFICQFLLGRRSLINDGYLLNNPITRRALSNRKHILSIFIDNGCVSVASRGHRYVDVLTPPQRRFGLHEMPERMSKIDSFNNLINNRVEGVPDWPPDWPTLRNSLEQIDRQLEDKRGYFSWSPYDTASGYISFTDKLIDSRSTARSLGLYYLISTSQLRQFLRLYREEMMSKPNLGPRNTWERIAMEFAEDPDVTNRGPQLLNALMRLANEIYHYNFGCGLTTAFNVPISIETQPSVAFDDLLLRKEIIVDSFGALPVPQIPRAITDVPPDKLLGILQNDSKLIDARQSYLIYLSSVRSLDVIPVEMSSTLSHLAKNYGREIRRAFARDMRFGWVDTAFDFAFSEARSRVKSGATTVAAHIGAAATAYGALKPNSIGAIVTDAAAYLGSAMLVFLAGEKFKPIATQLYRVHMAGMAKVPANLIKASKRAVFQIEHQRAPVSLELQRDAIAPIVAKMRKFVP